MSIEAKRFRSIDSALAPPTAKQKVFADTLLSRIHNVSQWKALQGEVNSASTKLAMSNLIKEMLKLTDTRQLPHADAPRKGRVKLRTGRV